MADKTIEPALMTVAQAQQAIRRAELSPSELIESCLVRTQSCEQKVHAWAYLGDDKARMAARLRDAHDINGDLHGIPFGVKDIIDTLDMPTQFGSPIYHDHCSHRDAACVALLKEAGGICLGKTVTTELAHFHPGKTRNPQATSHTPGGSSSGSAAAVAAGMVPFALGTQTTGSVLRPAAYCGVYGFKPSFGDINRSGVFECATSFDTLGWFTRGIEDIEIVRRALLRVPAQPLPVSSLASLRIGLFRGPDWDRAEASTQASIEDAVARLSTAGATITEVEPPAGFGAIAQHHRTIAGYEFARAISWERTERGMLLSPKLLLGRCEDGLQASYEAYAQAQAALQQQRLAFNAVMQEYDVLLTAVAPGEAWPGVQATGDPVFNTAWTALHLPALSAPVFSGPNGLPVGLQLVGGFRDDAALLSAASAICRALDLDIAPVANV
jgi:Asp-tRNA(Asn)/Glu-tRNA(Gln) amidotransferase A subunit family amidase